MREQRKAGWWRGWVAVTAVAALIGLGAVACDGGRDDDATEEAVEETLEEPAEGMGDAIPPVAASPTPVAVAPPMTDATPTPDEASPTPTPELP